MLSALAHARGARGMEVVTAAHDALVTLDAPLTITYRVGHGRRPGKADDAAVRSLTSLDAPERALDRKRGLRFSRNLDILIRNEEGIWPQLTI